MILAVIFGISIGVIAVTVVADAIRGNLSERSSMKTVKPKEVKKGITTYRNLKKIELGLARMQQHEARAHQSRGLHRRLQAS